MQVKHFKFEPRGKRRLHKKPSTGEIDHCRWWLKREFDIVKPKVIVALGRTAARAIFGYDVTIGDEPHGMFAAHLQAYVIVTVHPAAMLRLTDPDQKQKAWHRLVDDLRSARALTAQLPCQAVEDLNSAHPA